MEASGADGHQDGDEHASGDVVAALRDRTRRHRGDQYQHVRRYCRLFDSTLRGTNRATLSTAGWAMGEQVSNFRFVTDNAPLVPRDAATVMLVRDGERGMEVCMLRRNLNSDMGGTDFGVEDGGGWDGGGGDWYS